VARRRFASGDRRVLDLWHCVVRDRIHAGCMRELLGEARLGGGLCSLVLVLVLVSGLD
jgi:hypothetical protein